jgi:hypothetical protein
MIIDNIISKKSEIQGDGIFTTREYRKGDFVVKLTGKRIKRKYNEETDRKLCANWFGIGKDLWIDPNFPLSKINHSCNPNIGIKGVVSFYALRDIKNGEELTFDYATSEEESDWTMKCNCGSKKCRGKMTSIQFLPLEIYNNYLPYIPKYFQKVYRYYNHIK